MQNTVRKNNICTKGLFCFGKKYIYFFFHYIYIYIELSVLQNKSKTPRDKGSQNMYNNFTKKKKKLFIVTWIDFLESYH